MIATIELYEPLHDHLKTKTKWGELKPFKWVVRIGPIVIIKPSESSAHKYLTDLGFVLNEYCTGYDSKYKSEDEKILERCYRKR